MKQVSIVIPARWASERLPGKILADVNGKPLLRHVWERVISVSFQAKVVLAVDNQEVKEIAESWGAVCVMTPVSAKNGTERIACIVDALEGDWVINVQADQCFLDVSILNRMIELWDPKKMDILTPVFRIKEKDVLLDPNKVKVVLQEDFKCMYFSRSTVPFLRGEAFEKCIDKGLYWQHVGVYGYSKAVLKDYLLMPETPLESIEKLEQLRFLENEKRIYAFEVEKAVFSVDTEKDLAIANSVAMV